MKFAHLGDCHLGAWRFPELQDLSIQSFSKAVEISIKEQVDFVLIAGDLFDSAYPSIDTLKLAFKEFRKLNDSKIPCFIIPGSHDYSVSGKTFLDVLENAGFCISINKYEEQEDKLILQPTIYKNYALYGYHGKKSGLEVADLKKVELQDAPGFFKVLTLHTALREAIGNLPIDSLSITELPKADYYALGHLHIDFAKRNVVYSGPLFPTNFEELEELSHGQFYIVEYKEFLKTEKIPIKLKDVLTINIQLDNSLTATEKIISELKSHNLEDKIILLRLSGILAQGKISDIQFSKIEQFAKEKKAYTLIKNSSKLSLSESELLFDITDIHEAEEKLVEKYFAEDNSKFKSVVPEMIKSLDKEKHEDETNKSFQDRFLGEMGKILEF
ncbi:MAG: DNA repair exonuclease [Nanoarchaeota archaeon]|nr:DNA repair exonuclease [Nanoarchaeota archaeon]